MQNKKTVLQTIAVLITQKQYHVTATNIELGLLQVVKNTGLLGRWQQLGHSPKIICDTAHNKHGLTIVMNQVQKEKFDTLHIVLGVVNDKDLDEILPLFPKKAIYYFCKPTIFRGLDVAILAKKAIEFNLKGTIYHSVSEAYQDACTKAKSNDFIYIGGSTFVVAEIL